MAHRTKLVCLSSFYIRRTKTFSIYVYHISVLSYLASIDHKRRAEQNLFPLITYLIDCSHESSMPLHTING